MLLTMWVALTFIPTVWGQLTEWRVQFPRVVLMLEPETLQLSDECYEAIYQVKSDADSERFFNLFGNYTSGFHSEYLSRKTLMDGKKIFRARVFGQSEPRRIPQ